MTALTPEQVAAIVDLSAAFPGERLVVIGAVALGCHLPMTWRRTNDLDLTLAVDIDRFDELTMSTAWKRDAKLRYRFEHRSRLRVDLLPSSQRHLDAGELTFADTGQVMNLTGFDLALRHHVATALGEGAVVAVASVPAIVVLKMAAFLDRPSERSRDLEDLAAVFEQYLGGDDARRWEPPIVDSGVEFRHQGALALGIDIAEIAEAKHRALVVRFLAALHAEGAHRGRMVRVTPGPADERDELLHGWFAAFELGLSTT